jgi:hypothetical protein
LRNPVYTTEWFERRVAYPVIIADFEHFAPRKKSASPAAPTSPATGTPPAGPSRISSPATRSTTSHGERMKCRDFLRAELGIRRVCFINN